MHFMVTSTYVSEFKPNTSFMNYYPKHGEELCKIISDILKYELKAHATISYIELKAKDPNILTTEVQK